MKLLYVAVSKIYMSRTRCKRKTRWFGGMSLSTVELKMLV